MRTYFFVDTRTLPDPPPDARERNIHPYFICKADSVEDAQRQLLLSRGVDATHNPHIKGSWVPVNEEPQ